MRIKCPHCKTLTTWEENPWRPFCSERCKLIDLGMWVEERYKIEGGADEEDDDKDNDAEK